jgi:hypothetical protein
VAARTQETIHRPSAYSADWLPGSTAPQRALVDEQIATSS